MIIIVEDQTACSRPSSSIRLSAFQSGRPITVNAVGTACTMRTVRLRDHDGDLQYTILPSSNGWRRVRQINTYHKTTSIKTSSYGYYYYPYPFISISFPLFDHSYLDQSIPIPIFIHIINYNKSESRNSICDGRGPDMRRLSSFCDL
jgi:hypothetical protein